jgi:hypothetical protein
MKKIVFYTFLTLWLSSLSALAQTEGYNPSNPPNPGSTKVEEADTTTYYTLSLAYTPKGIGSGYGAGSYTANRSISVGAYSVDGCNFLYWVDDDGNVVSTSRSFYYTMPARNVQLTAVYRYNPSNPANPEVQEKVKTYDLTLVAKPTGAGSFSPNGTVSMLEGDARSLYAYTNSDFVFLRWEDANGETLSTARNFYYTMPAKNTTLYGIYEYCPSNPANPGKNAWDSFSGEVIVDDFSSGYLSNAIYNVIGGSSNASQVTSITVAGVVNTNDFSIANNFSNCSIVDLSRTTGVTRVPNWCFDSRENLTQVVLPSTIESVGYCAFYNCSSLSSLTVYANTPPTVEEKAFYNMPEDLIVFVPEASIELYEASDSWNQYQILPIQSNVHSLELTLPAECSDGRYKNMSLELVNLKSGQRYKYVITDRLNYVFNNLMKNTKYNAYLKNPSGIVLASVDTIVIADRDLSCAFENILSLQNLSLRVITPAGADVTSQVTVSWYDEEGNYLSQGNTLASQVEGHEVRFSMALPQALALKYALPQDSTYSVRTGENAIEYTLTALPTTTVSGRVLDVSTDQPISGATVTVTQTLNGTYSKSVAVKTDNKGAFSSSLFVAPTEITVASNDYVSKTVVLTDSLLALPEIALGDVSLKSITGAVVSLNFSYTTSVEAGSEASTQSWYSDYNNVSYTLYNSTRQKAIKSFSVQYPEIVLLEEVDEGDVIRVTATSKNGAFTAVTAEGAIDETNRTSVTLPIVQLGSLKASYGHSENSSVVAMLYDATGTFLQKASYESGSLTFSELKDGSYTLVTMGESSVFNTLNKLSAFAESDLVLGTDYIQNVVEVKSGAITTVKNALVPLFDDSKMFYTGTGTSFTVNKSSLVAGNYLTLQAKVDFKSLYANKVKDIEVVFDLPEGSSLVANSLMVGSALTNYQEEGRTVTVSLPNASAGRVRFCVIPTVSGTSYSNAYVRFTLDGNTVTQPIGTASYEVQDLSIQVPSMTSKSTFSVSGAATGKSSVEIYDGTTVIGKTTAYANGVWGAECTLVDPTNLSKHNIHAKVITTQGLEMQTETQSITYDVNSIELSRVHMYHWNPEMNKNYDIVYDYQNPSSVAQKYTYYIYNKQFSFTVDFTDNDPDRILNVYLNVKTGNGTWTTLPTTFDSKKKCWVASAEFGNMYDGNIPKNVAVSYDMITPMVVDKSDMEETVSMYDRTTEALSASTEYGSELVNQLVDAYFDEKYNETLVQQLENKVYDMFGLTQTEHADITSEEDARAFLEEVKEVFSDSLLLATESILSTRMEDLMGVAEYAKGIKVGTCDSISEVSLIDGGYNTFEVSDSSQVYYRVTDTEISIVDFERNYSACVVLNNDAESTEKGSVSTLVDNFASKASSAIGSISEDLSKAKASLNQYKNMVYVAYGLSKKKFAKMLTTLKWAADEKRVGTPVVGMNLYEDEYRTTAKSGGRTMTGTNMLLNNSNGPYVKIMEKITDAYDIIEDIRTEVADVRELQELYNSVPDSMDIKATTESDIETEIAFQSQSIAGDVALADYVMKSAKALVPTAGTSVSALTGDVIFWIIKVHYGRHHRKNTEGKIMTLRKRLYEVVCNAFYPTSYNWHYCCGQDADVSIDPSGYVYEGVQSNRLAGVTATCYYKETVADMYGDLSENIVLWNAEEYAQENPLFTDEQGGYRWDVPEGLWQVKFEKEGYQTTYSDWLPVPPPQLEINIGMVQNAQPEVKSAKAYEEDVEITFSKYMDVETLTADNVKLKVITGDSEKFLEDVKVTASDAETEENGTFASTVALTTEQDLGTVDEVYVIVSKKVQSYAGIQMTEDFTQKLDVEKKVRNIEVDSVVNVGNALTQQVLVAAQPAEASKGKKLTVRSASTLFATVAGDDVSETSDGVYEVALDENGQATITVSGEMNGTTALTYSVEDATATAVSTVNVVDASKLAEVAEVVASYATGSALYRGQTVTLTCETDGATIYYTLDGSCPCESTRLTYERPIAVTDSVTIKAMSVGVNGSESEVKSFVYTIKQSNLQVELAKGWNWMSHNLSETVADTDLEQEGVSRLLTQDGEVTKDPVLGYVGSLGAVAADEAVKVQTESGLSLSFSGEIYNPTKTAVYLQKGWNWLGYPLDQTMSIGEALANLEVEEGDYITNLTSGYAEFTNGAWTGSLSTLTPGQGYLYKSVSDKQFVYNNSIVSKAKALYARRLSLSVAPWSVDVHKYPSMMCVTASLYDETTKVASGVYTVGAFVNGECRGVGSYVNDVIFLSVYGDAAETVDFVAVDNETGECFGIRENVVYTPDVLGSVSAPYALTLGEATAIESVRADGNGAVGDVYNVLGQKLQNIRKEGVYVVNGKKIWISNKTR